MPDTTERATLRAVYAMDDAFMGLGNTTVNEPGATIVHNADALRVRDANHVSLIAHDTAPTFDALLAYTDTILGGAPARVIKTSALTPPDIAAQLLCAGFKRDDGVFLLLEGPLRAGVPAHEVRLMETDADWAAWRTLDAMNWAETTAKVGVTFSEEFQGHYATLKRARTRAIQYWLAYADGAPRAFLSSWEGINGIGMLEDLFTQPEYRHRGLATSLIAHAVADVRARRTQRIAIPADAQDTPKHMYAALGFRPLSLHTTFWQQKSGDA